MASSFLQSITSYFVVPEEQQEDQAWTDVGALPGDTQFYNVRGWEVVDRCTVLAEISQKEAIASKRAVLPNAKTETKTTSTSTQMIAPLPPSTPPTTKRSSSMNCRGPVPPASVVLERLAPRTAGVQAQLRTDDFDFDGSSPPPHPSARAPGFSYAAVAATAVSHVGAMLTKDAIEADARGKCATEQLCANTTVQ